jgi:hypothetical protein
VELCNGKPLEGTIGLIHRPTVLSTRQSKTNSAIFAISSGRDEAGDISYDQIPDAIYKHDTFALHLFCHWAGLPKAHYFAAHLLFGLCNA